MAHFRTHTPSQEAHTQQRSGFTHLGKATSLLPPGPFGKRGPAPPGLARPRLAGRFPEGAGSRAPRPPHRPQTARRARPRPRPRPASVPPYLAPRLRPGEAASGQGPRDVARSRSRAGPHHVQQWQRVRTQGRRGTPGHQHLGGDAGPGLPPHPWGPAESGADGKRGGAARPGSPGVAQEGRDPGPGRGRAGRLGPGGARRSIAPRADGWGTAAPKSGWRKASFPKVGCAAPALELSTTPGPCFRGPVSSVPSVSSHPSAWPHAPPARNRGHKVP